MVILTIACFTLLGFLRDRVLLALAFGFPVVAISVVAALLPDAPGIETARLPGADGIDHPWTILAVGTLAAPVLLLVAARGATLLLGDEESGMVRRLRIAPIADREILFGRAIALHAASAAGLMSLFLWSRLALKMDLTGKTAPLITLAVAAGVLGAGIGLLLTAAPAQRALAAIATAIILTVLLLGGSIVPPDLLPPWLRWWGALAPNGPLIWGIAALYGSGGHSWRILPHAALLALGGALAIAAAAALLRRRSSEHRPLPHPR